jgi:hypothetical protein
MVGNLKYCVADADGKVRAAGIGPEQDRRGPPDDGGRQTGAPLGERLKSAWEWAAVLGQVEVYGRSWRKLDIRCHCLAVSAVLVAESVKGEVSK